MSQRNSSGGTSGSASSPSSGVSSQLTGSHAGAGNSPAALAAQLVSQQLLMHGSLGALSSQEIQALASTLQQQQSLQQSLQQHLQQIAMFQQANPATGQLPAQAQFFLQNQVCPIFKFSLSSFPFAQQTPHFVIFFSFWSALYKITTD